MERIEKTTPAQTDDIALIAGKLIHEIKNPLNIIYMNLQLLDEEWRDEDGPRERRLKQKIALLMNESGRLRDILDEFLHFARSTSVFEKVSEDLNAVVEEVADFVRPETTANRIRLMTTYDSPPPQVEMDRNLIKQALLNILLNAVNALETGGDIFVKTFAQDRWAYVDIFDTGPGIPEKIIGKIFEPYFSTRSKGSGLGLSTTKKIIEAHGGSVSVESTPGTGTNFRIKLPLEENDRPDDQTA